MTAEQKAKQLRAFRILFMRAVEKGVNKAMIGVQRKAVLAMPYLAPEIPANPPPGPLARRSGDLSRTIKPMKASFRGNILIGGLQAGGKGIGYARIHELGGITGAAARRFYLPPRPYLRPHVEEALPEVQRSILAELDALEKKLGLA